MTSAIQPQFYEATRTLFVKKKKKTLFNNSFPPNHVFHQDVILRSLSRVRKLLDLIRNNVHLCSEDKQRSYGFETT